MDIKCDGLSYEILEKALMQAKAGREHILGKLTECMPAPRAELKPHVPRIVQITIPKEFIGAVIGPGGKIIQGMQEETGATINIDEVDGVGRIEIAGTNKACIDSALAKIKAIVAIPEVGEVYKARYAPSCLTVHLSSSSPVRTACSTSPRWIGVAWTPWKRRA